jgi:hypothetical protein
LIGNIWWNISLRRHGYLKLKHGFLPMAENSILMASCLKARLVLEFLSEELDIKASFALETFPHCL